MIKNFVYIALVGFTLWLSGGCGTGPVVDTGGASETVSIIITDTAFYGKTSIIDDEGVVSVNSFVDVHFYESDFLPIFPSSVNNITSSTASDSNGEFLMRHKGAGYYSIYAKDIISRKALFYDSIEVSEGELDTIEAAFDPVSTISGFVSVVDTGNGDTTQVSEYYIYVTGTPFLTITGNLGAFSLDTLPQGNYAIKTVEVIPETAWVDIGEAIIKLNNKPAKNVSVTPGDTVKNIDIFVLQK